MALPWKTLDRFTDGNETLELRQRGAKDFLITLGSQVLMNSMAQRSEMALGTMGCKGLEHHGAPRVLVGGLGMGCTLRAVLDALPETAEVVVAELNPRIVEWCRGPLAPLTGGAVSDPRVTVSVGDVAALIAGTACGTGEKPFDAIIIDLYRGPHPKTDKTNDPFYGSRAIANACKALKPGGTFAVWGETFDEAFLKRMTRGGFKATCERPGKGGYRHAVFLGKKAG
ncbi:spermidine synthase [Desulfoluna spongiiphila]|uniref:Spermine/spermidine synthase n=1 Tax=Desulfoluna spongiiphila TaxID=419481 RepID=A0A1G5JBC5_9BACT|nr:spermidine synthase [Desulfoluna spongiiphila]SCY85494.1 Spermine/spermidine synthase [Desulfoluna spongiiphila]